MARSVVMLTALAQAYADKVSYAGLATGDPGPDGSDNDAGIFADLTWPDDAADGTILSASSSFDIPGGGLVVAYVTFWSVDDEFLDARPYSISFDDPSDMVDPGELYAMTDTIAFTDGGAGDLEILMGDLEVDSDMTITVLDDKLSRAPVSITLVIAGGRPNEDVTILVDNHNTDDPTPDPFPLYADTLDTEGSLGPLSITITGDYGGAMGENTVYAHQLAEDGTTVMEATDTYSLTRTPQTYPIVQGADQDPIAIDGAYDADKDIYHFVLQDLLGVEYDGIGSWVWNPGPTTMTSPHVEFSLTSEHTTAHSGIFHLWQAGEIPKDWQLVGTCYSEVVVEKLEEYADLNRRIWIIDEHNRAWKCVIENLDITPHKRQIFNGEWTDWGHDYTMDITILDQDWATPV